MSDMGPEPTINVVAGTRFVVLVPPWHFGTATDIQIGDPSAVSEICSVLLADRGRRAVFKALAPGNGYLDATITPSTKAMMPAWSAEVTVTPPPAAEGCARHQLSVSLEHSGVALGHVGMTLGFTNTGPRACWLYGYPDIQMLNADGEPLPTKETTGTAYTVPPVAETPVTLAVGTTASFYIGFDDGTGYGSASCPTSSSVAISPPGSQASTVIPLSISPYGGSLTAVRCGEITVSPVFAGTAGAP